MAPISSKFYKDFFKEYLHKTTSSGYDFESTYFWAVLQPPSSMFTGEINTFGASYIWIVMSKAAMQPHCIASQAQKYIKEFGHIYVLGSAYSKHD